MIKKLLKKLHSYLYSANKKEDYLYAMNELLYYSISAKDRELENSLEEFYYDEFLQCRKNVKDGEAVVYSNLLYEANYNVIALIIDNKGTTSKTIEHRTTSGVWLLGEIYYTKISEDTYTWLWRNLILIVENEDYVRNYWENVSMYFDYSLKSIDYEYNGKDQISNTIEIKNREKERLRFLEFQYIFVGMLLYKKQYHSLNFILTHTRSMPADYSLLPKNMTDVIDKFKYFNQDIYRLSRNYSYPGIQWVNSTEIISKWVNNYIAILFLREFVLRKPQGFPEMGEYNIYVKRQLLDNIPLLHNSVNSIFKNNELLIELDSLFFNSEALLIDKKEIALKYLDGFSEHIKTKIDYNIASAELAKEKISLFYDTSKEILEVVFDLLERFKNLSELSKETELKKYIINGYTEVYSKSAFIEGDIPHMNFHEVFAQSLSHRIKFYFTNTFIISRTRSYLIKKEEYFNALKKLKVTEEFILLGINFRWDVNEVVSSFKEYPLELISSNNSVENTLYILRRDDLPFIKHKELSKEERLSNKLDKVISEKYQIYSSILDLNKEVDIRKKIIEEHDSRTHDELVKSVQISLAFITEIIWKKDAEVVQLSIQSQYSYERGVLNEIDDIIPFSDKKVPKKK